MIFQSFDEAPGSVSVNRTLTHFILKTPYYIPVFPCVRFRFWIIFKVKSSLFALCPAGHSQISQCCAW